MKKILKYLFILSITILMTSCGTLSDDKFVYIGHGTDTPNYRLYYNKTRQQFVLVDKKHGCYERDNSGTCFAIDIPQTKKFRHDALAKMLDIDMKIAKDNYGATAIKELEKADISTVKKSVEIPDIKVTPIKQILLDRQKEYHLVNKEYNLKASMVAMVTTDGSNKDYIKVVYTLSIPKFQNSQNTTITPFIVDPEFLYKNMTIESVKQAEQLQKYHMKDRKKVKKEIKTYLSNVVDKQTKEEPKKEKPVSTDTNEDKLVKTANSSADSQDSESDKSDKVEADTQHGNNNR